MIQTRYGGMTWRISYIVAKYNIKERIEEDFRAMASNTAASVPHVVIDSLAFNVDLNDIFQ